MNKFFFSFSSSLYSKITLAMLAGFLVVGFILSLLMQKLTVTYQHEVEQKLHLELAAQIVKGNAILKDGEFDIAALKNAFHSMMVLGPGFEFYLLDENGNIQTYSADPEKIKRQQINLQPIVDFLSGSTMLPILGDDPRSLSRQKIFSVAPVFDNRNQAEKRLMGYLYIIIGGEIYDNVVELLKGSHIAKLSSWNLMLALVFIAIIVLLIFAMLTRPLKRLTREIQQFQREGFVTTDSLPENHWNRNSNDEIQRLGCSYHDMATELQNQYRNVKNTDELRKELISYVSHDLRTPLASLQGYLETWQLKGDSLNRQQSEHLISTALKNAQKMSDLVEQLFELAHLDSGTVKLNIESVAIAELIQDVMQNLQYQAEKQGVTLILTPQDTSLIVLADIARLERVFTNLIDNAIRHCVQGDLVTAQLTISADNTDLIIRLIDTGSGIPEQDLPNLFEAHYRASNSLRNTVANKPNSGLGLAIVKRILNLHGTDIDLTSQLGQGSEFTFKLPLIKPKT